MQGDKLGEDGDLGHILSSQAETSHSNSTYCVHVRSLLWLIMAVIISVHIQAGTRTNTLKFCDLVVAEIVIFIWDFDHFKFYNQSQSFIQF